MAAPECGSAAALVHNARAGSGPRAAYNAEVPTDTHPSMAERQLELLRAAGPAGRASAALALSRTAIEASRAALRRLHPSLSEREILRLWVSLHYGEDLARRVFDRP